MPGQIIPRGKSTWLVRMSLGRDPETGVRKHHNHTIHGTKKDAQTYLTKKLRERDLGVFSEPSAMLVGDYLDQWLKMIRTKVRERTYRGYKASLDLYIRPKLGKTKLSAIGPLQVQAVYDDLQTTLSPKTIRNAHIALSGALKQAVEWGMISTNATKLVKLPKRKRREFTIFSTEEAMKFLKALSGKQHETLFRFALETGMRPEEYLALKWSDVDFARSTVRVQRTLLRKEKGGWAFEECKTDKSRRSIKVSGNLIDRLRIHKTEQLSHRMEAANLYEPLDLVFASNYGRPIDHDNLANRHFRPLLKKAELRSIRLYDLRHTCASLLLASGENPKVVSERLGHSSVAITLDTYSHVLPNLQDQATNRLADLLYSTPTISGGK